MAEFHETRMGQKFFMADVPRLIAALERIADILEQRRVDEKRSKQNTWPEDFIPGNFPK